MKTLYSILGVRPDATAEQIEHAYAKSVARLQDAGASLSAEEVSNQTIANREAYTTLTNPILRQRYDQKLSAADLTRVQVTEYSVVDGAATGGVFGFKTILLVGVIVLLGIYIYNNNAKERERLRIAHEHEVQMKAIQIAEDQQRQNAKVQDVILDKASSYADAQQLRMTQQQFERESAQRQQFELQQRRLEMQQQEQQQRLQQQQDANRQRQEQQQRQQQLQSEKRLLQQMERDRYGKVITY